MKKYVSERHAEAKAAGKLTAGQVAAKLNRKFKPAVKIKAKELKPFANEWHHSGFYKGSSSGSTMGRTYFFDAATNLDQLYKLVCDARIEAAKAAAEPEVERFWFVTGFERVVINRFGKLGYKPIAEFCHQSTTPKKGTEISREDYLAMQQFAGERLEAYESFTHFKERMEVQNGDENQKVNAA